MTLTFFKTKTNTYIFKNDHTYTNSHLIINDNIVIKGVYPGKEIELTEIPINVNKVENISEISHYENKTEKYSVQDYNIYLTLLISKADDLVCYESDLTFSNIDDEYAYKKFKSLWNPIYITKEIKTTIPFEIKECVYSDYPEIVPLYQIGSPIDDPTCIFKTDYKQYLKKICSVLNVEYKEDKEDKPIKSDFYIVNADHSYIHYAKMNNNYIFTSSNEYKEDKTFRMTYSECVTKRKEIFEKLHNIITLQLNLLKHPFLGKNERIELKTELNNILNCYKKVEPTKKTYAQYIRILDNISKLIEII